MKCLRQEYVQMLTGDMLFQYYNKCSKWLLFAWSDTSLETSEKKTISYYVILFPPIFPFSISLMTFLDRLIMSLNMHHVLSRSQFDFLRLQL